MKLLSVFAGRTLCCSRLGSIRAKQQPFSVFSLDRRGLSGMTDTATETCLVKEEKESIPLEQNPTSEPKIPSDSSSPSVREDCDRNQNLKRSVEDDGSLPTSKKPKIKKKKVAMLMSYCGQGYLGMQKNHGFRTIEGDLFEAFQKLDIMDEDSYKVPQSIHFQRAARTDKGVKS